MACAPTISIIMTVYDAKDYLPLAVQSVLAQTFADFELLLVEDGSPNGCGALCDELAKTDPRIRVFHKPNGGPASASNMGLDNARGRYVGFVDSDDLAEPDLYQKLYDAIQSTGARLACCSADAIDESGAQIPGREVVCEYSGEIEAMQLFVDAFKNDSFYGPLSWNKLFDIALFRGKGIRYDETMYYGDDASVLHLVFEGERAVCLPDKLYHYRSRTGSITGTAFSPRKLDDLRMYWDWLTYFAARPGSGELHQRAVARYWQLFYLFWCLAGAAGNQKELKPLFLKEKKHLDSVLPEVLRCPYVSAGEKARLILFTISPTFTYTLASAWGKVSGRS